MISADTAVNGLSKAIIEADLQLTNLSTRLQTEFSQNTPSYAQQPNPYTLLKRLSSLQAQLPSLREQLLSNHQQKAQLASLCRSDLADAARFARHVLPVTAPEHSRSVAAKRSLLQTDETLNNLIASFYRAHGDFLVAKGDAPLPDDDLNLALLRAAADAPRLDMGEDNKGKDNGTEENQPSPSDKKAGRKKTTLGDKASKGESKPNPKEVAKSAPIFEPVSKAVYNRLPRNLKVRAGKLPQVNEFYEQVFRLLVERGPMSDKELMTATGETNMQRFEVLRGLAVLRNGKTGWQLSRAR